MVEQRAPPGLWSLFRRSLNTSSGSALDRPVKPPGFVHLPGDLSSHHGM